MDANGNMRDFPKEIPNYINGAEQPAVEATTFRKLAPADGSLLFEAARSTSDDVRTSVAAARGAQTSWAETPAVVRGQILHEIVLELRRRRDDMARMVAAETGRSTTSAAGETDGAVALGLFFASEGQRMYGKTATSAVPNRIAKIIREPVGVAGLIIAANTPIANVAWKVFPALICGNGVVLKASEDAPGTAWLFAKIAHAAGLPDGVLNVIQGLGAEAGAPLVDHPDVGVISFTGSTEVGREVAVKCAQRLAKVSLELGGKNPFVVCDDADLELAVNWAVLSAFSNAGQRCAAGSRIIVFEKIYDKFRDAFVTAAEKLKLGTAEEDDLGPVINERQLRNMLDSIEHAKAAGATVLTGGRRPDDESLQKGYYLSPTIVEDVDPASDFSCNELFGPIAAMYRVQSFAEAVQLANDSPYGLTACIHTRDVNRAHVFARSVQAGVVSINGATYGSEPHMPFGGVKQSGNGTREPGTEALDVYSSLKNVLLHVDSAAV